MNEKLKVFLWQLIKGPGIWVEYMKTKRRYTLPMEVMDSQNTIAYIRENKNSVCRFGDGELQMISHYLSGGDSHDFEVDTFQSYSPVLAERLLSVLSSSDNKTLVCIPYPFIKPSVYKGYDSLFFMREWIGRARMLSGLLHRQILGDTTFTRFYLHRKDIKDYASYVKSLKSLWHGREIVIVEGEYSRLGVGNDLFDNVERIERIICPSTNAFDRYDDILAEVKNMDKSKLVILALGHTATVLAYELSELGYQAMDLGHVDIEYEWMRLGVKDKVPVKNKYVNEVSAGRIANAEMDSFFESQVIAKIL